MGSTRWSAGFVVFAALLGWWGVRHEWKAAYAGAPAAARDRPGEIHEAEAAAPAQGPRPVPVIDVGHGRERLGAAPPPADDLGPPRDPLLRKDESTARSEFTPWDDIVVRYLRDKYEAAPTDESITEEPQDSMNDAFRQYKAEALHSRIDCRVGICRMAFTFQGTDKTHALNTVPRPPKWDLSISPPQQTKEGTSIIIYATPFDAEKEAEGSSKIPQ